MATVSTTISEVPAVSSRRFVMVQTLVALLLGAAMALYFWMDSRYPALLKKFHSGPKVQISGALSFDARMPVTPAMPLPQRVGRTTINWIWTNRIGMTFGICFGAAAMTLLGTLRRKRFASPAANTLLGIAAGAPLGVCANCVAPIGRGLFISGSSAETALAAMISSPTLNVVVLAMTFTLFPWRIALLRLAVPLALLGLVPWLARRSTPVVEAAILAPAGEGWLQPTRFTLKAYLWNLGRLALTTVPFMIVAGFLGALAIELLPVPNGLSHVSGLGVIGVALVGTFLPVPMAFDVAAAYLLMARGVPLPYVVTLLCTLGAFSIYSVLILGKTISWRTAGMVFGAVMACGVLAGLGTALAQHIF